MNSKLKEQLEEIRNLKEDWFENSFGKKYGKPFSQKTINNTEIILNNFFNHRFDFDISPVPQNNMLIEITGFKNINSIDIEIFDDTVYLTIFEDLYDNNKVFHYTFKSVNEELLKKISHYFEKE